MKNKNTLALLFLISIFAFPLSSFAQITTVTGTVKDTNGVPYAGASLKAQLMINGSNVTGQPVVTINNQGQCISAGAGNAPCKIPFQGTSGPISLDPTGSFTMNLQDNTQVTPASTQWLFTVNSPGNPPPLGTGPQTCSATVTISGASQSISSSFSSCPALSNTGGGGGVGGTSGIDTVGLVGFYQALTTDTVASLKDYSGAGNNATGTIGTAPTIIAGTGGLNCTGAGGVLLPASLNSALTLIAVVNYQQTQLVQFWGSPLLGNGTPATSGVGLAVGRLSSAGFAAPQIFGGMRNNFGGGGALDETEGYVGGVQDWAMALDASHDQIYSNGLPLNLFQFGGSAGAQTTGVYSICGAAAGSGSSNQTYFIGTVYAILIYNVEKTAQQILSIHNALQTYLGSRGIQITPYRSDNDNFLWAYGDSTTVGSGFTSWPTRAVGFSASYDIQNMGVSGTTSAQLLSIEPQMGFATCSGGGGRSAMVLLTGANDAIAQTIYGNARGILQAIKSPQCSKMSTILLTMMDKGGGDALHDAYNLLMRTNCASSADYCIDLGGTVALGADAANTSAVYFQADHLHPTQAGGDVLTWVTQRGINRFFGNHTFTAANTYAAPATAAVSVTNATQTGNVMTFTSATNTFSPGQCIIVAGVTPANYNSTFANSAGLGCWYALGTTTTSFTAYNQTTGLGNLTVAGTASVPEQQDVDQVVILNFGAGNFTLESCEGLTADERDITTIKNINATSSTIVPFGAQTIDGAATLTITQNQVIRLQAQLISPAAGGCNWTRVQ